MTARLPTDDPRIDPLAEAIWNETHLSSARSYEEAGDDQRYACRNLARKWLAAHDALQRFEAGEESL